MKEEDRLARNKQRLTTMDAHMALAVRDVLTRMENHGFRPRIQAAWRSEADQIKAFNSGNSKVKFGFHNITGANGRKEALACDILDDDAPLGPSTSYLLRLAIAARHEHLSTGIFWGLSDAHAAGVSAAIAALDTEREVHVGWDPTHVEVVGITIAQARKGKRPTFPAAGAPVATVPAGAQKFHVVVANDTLSGIAKANRLSLVDILDLNPKKRANPNLILVGEKIRIK